MKKVDQTGLKTGQLLTISLLILGFVLNSWVWVAFVGVAQLLGALASPIAPYRLIYQYIVQPSQIVKPRVIPDHPESHRFAMFIGAIFNTIATVALLAGSPVFGWVLVALVVVLANVNFWLNFCLGCWMYYQFNRFGVPGFEHALIED